MVNLRKKALASNAIPLARNNLPGFVSNLTSNAIKNLKKKKISGKRAVRAGKGFTLFISNENMNDIIKVQKSLEDFDALIDGVTETVTWNKKQEGRFLEALSSLSLSSYIFLSCHF